MPITSAISSADMSLKAFHIFFILTSILLCLGFGAWQLQMRFSGGGGFLDLVLGILSLLSGVLLMVYFKSMLRKLRDISYL